MNKELIVTLLN